ncbi:MAG TPA: hypothetical protein VKB26_04065 [Candidatus Acidoferrales bacterium]|nr:hypothetical protein [Candidatus Acidoferrales bacterium]
MSACGKENLAAASPLEERFQLFVGAVQDCALFVFDLEGNVTTRNSGAETHQGLPRFRNHRTPFSCFYPEED